MRAWSRTEYRALLVLHQLSDDDACPAADRIPDDGRPLGTPPAPRATPS